MCGAGNNLRTMKKVTFFRFFVLVVSVVVDVIFVVLATEYIVQREGPREPVDGDQGQRGAGDDDPPPDQSTSTPGAERRNPEVRDRDEGDGGGRFQHA